MDISLIEALKNKNVILFVGAGISMQIGLPSWSNIIDKMASELGFDTEVFKSFGDYLALAEYYEIKRTNIGSLRSWMDRTWHQNYIKIEESIVHKNIVELDFPIIYTTNYDRWIEESFNLYKKGYTKISNVGDLVNINTNKTQIIKFHGDFDDDQSIVLTESDYFDRLDFETPLDIKLRSDVLGKSILFIGYSLNDINLRYMFYKLNKLWNRSNCSSSRPKSYIFLAKPNPVQEAVLERRGIKMIISEKEDINEGLKYFLEKLKKTSSN